MFQIILEQRQHWNIFLFSRLYKIGNISIFQVIHSYTIYQAKFQPASKKVPTGSPTVIQPTMRFFQKIAVTPLHKMLQYAVFEQLCPVNAKQTNAVLIYVCLCFRCLQIQKCILGSIHQAFFYSDFSQDSIVHNIIKIYYSSIFFLQLIISHRIDALNINIFKYLS